MRPRAGTCLNPMATARARCVAPLRFHTASLPSLRFRPRDSCEPLPKGSSPSSAARRQRAISTPTRTPSRDYSPRCARSAPRSTMPAPGAAEMRSRAIVWLRIRAPSRSPAAARSASSEARRPRARRARPSGIVGYPPRIVGTGRNRSPLVALLPSFSPLSDHCEPCATIPSGFKSHGRDGGA